MSGQPCPAREELHAFHVGTLVDDRSEALIEHISTCPGCQATLETLGTAGDALLERLRSPAPCDPYEEEPDCQEAVATIQAMAETTLTVAARPPVPAPATPSRLGEYEVLEKLGEGGMGAVYKARHTRLDRMAALKVLPKERTVSPDAVARFEREMKAVGRLSHANIVQAHDARDIEGTTVLVMEYVEGKDLSLLVQEAGALPIADACELLRQAALGLQYAHEHGLVHRDIKPSNLMLTHEGRVKILDLGLALLRTEQTGGEEITAAGQVMGTADYLAPEQVTDSHQVDIRADIYSLGCTLYKLLSGRAPFGHLAARGAMAKMLAHVQEPPLPIRSLRADVPEALAAVLGRMLAKAPAERFATPGEVAEALAPFTAGANVAALLAAAQVASGPSAATEALAPATDPAVLSAMTGTQPSPSAPTVGRAGQPQAAPAPKPLATPWKPRNRVAALAAGAAAAVVLLGVVIIIKDRFGRQTVVNVPGSDVTIEVRPDGELSKVASPPSPPAPLPLAGEGSSAATKPAGASPIVAAEPVSLAEGAPLSPSAIVARPAKIPGVKSWTIETVGHRGRIHTLAFSPDNSLLAASSVDDAVRLWDTSTGKLVRVLFGAGPAIDWSPDGKQLATSGPHGSIRIWAPGAGRLLKTLRGTLPVQSIAWSPDGKVLAIAAGPDDPIGNCPNGRRVQVRDLESGRSQDVEAMVHGCSKSGDYVGGTELRWSPDGVTLAIAGANNRVFLWGRSTAKILREFPSPDQSGYFHYHVDWSPDGKHLLSAVPCISSGIHKVYVWNIQSGKLERQLEKSVLGFFSPDDRLLLARAEGYAFASVLFEDDRGPLAQTRHSTPYPKYTYRYISALGSSPDRKLAGVGWVAGDIEILDLDTGQVRAFAAPGHAQAFCEALRHDWSPDGEKIGIAHRWSGNSLVDLRSPEKSRLILTLGALSSRGLCSPDGQRVIFHSLHEAAAPSIVHEVDDLKVLWKLPGMSSAWSPDGERLATFDGKPGASGAKVWIWSAKSGKLLCEIAAKVRNDSAPHGQSTVAWRPDARLLALAAYGITIWDAESGKVVRQIPEEEGLFREVSWSPDGRILAALYMATDGAVRRGESVSDVELFDATSGKRIGTLKTSHHCLFLRAWWTADGKLVTSGDGTVNTWDVAKRQVIQTVTLPGKNSAGDPMRCVLSPDVTRAAEPVSAYMRIWEIASKKVLGAVVPLRDDDSLLVSSDGHYHGTPNVERFLVYVVLSDSGEQLTLTPEEFAKRYGWKNDSTKVQLAPPAGQGSGTAKKST